MKTIKLGSVRIKVNARGHAKKTLTCKKDSNHFIKGKGYKTFLEDTLVEQDIYVMPFQSKNKVFKGSNGKNTFNPATCEAYSYNHWLYVQKIKGKIVFNAYNYSKTTTQHQWQMRDLLKELGLKIYLEVNTRDSLRHFKASSLAPMYRALFELETALKRINSKPEKNKVRRKAIADIKNDIRKARALGAVFTKENIEVLRKTVETEELTRIDDMKRERKAKAELLKARRDIISKSETFDLQVA